MTIEENAEKVWRMDLPTTEPSSDLATPLLEETLKIISDDCPGSLKSFQ